MGAPDKYADLIAGIEAAGLSKSEIARQSGISRGNVYRFANGEARDPAYVTVAKLEELARRVGAPVMASLQSRR